MKQQRKLRLAWAAAVVALAVGAMSTAVQAQPGQAPHGAGQAGSTGASTMAAGGMDMKSMMKANNEQMAAMAMTGKPDVDFAMMMRIHHQGAIDMAQAELKDGKNPEMRKLATEIIAAQKKEIAQFDRFLKKQGHSIGAMAK